MAIYRFRVTFEEDEEIYREIEIKSSHNFEDFHAIIVKSIDFKGDHDASFYISDDLWRKGEEIKLRPSSEDQESCRMMNNCKMAALIDDPHQKFVYVYDPKSNWSFLVELIKIVEDDLLEAYPKCNKSIGIAPKNTTTGIIVPDLLEEDDIDDELPVDDEAYTNAHCEEGIADLEAEEGEEENTEEEENQFENFAEQDFDED